MTDLLTDDWLISMRERDARLQAVLAEAIATATATRDALDVALFTLDNPTNHLFYAGVEEQL